MFYLVLIWFAAWCLVKLVKPTAIPTVLIVALILAALVTFGVPHLPAR